jgi:acetyl-CoA carboxylase carboxyltransferase component
MGKWMDGYLSRLLQNHEDNLAGGGRDRIEIQHGLGKLTARERIDYLVDPGSFDELGSMVKDPYRGRVERPKPSPTDGLVMGMARVNGRQAMVYSMDFTVMSGAIGIQGIWKLAEITDMAGREVANRCRLSA